MFWLNKNSKKKKADKRKRSEGDNASGENAQGRPLSSEEIRAQALANARNAREQIGDETLQKIAAAMTKKQNSPMERAKSDIASADADRVAQEILGILGEK